MDIMQQIQNGDLVHEAKNLAMMINALPEEQAQRLSDVAASYLLGIEACIRTLTNEED